MTAVQREVVKFLEDLVYERFNMEYEVNQYFS